MDDKTGVISGLSYEEIQNTNTFNYERHIAPLLEKGLLSMTLPDKPKSKKQKYITTEKGKALLKKTENKI